MAPALVKSLSRLNRSTLTDLALKWLQPCAETQPYLACNRTLNESEEEDYLFTSAEDIAELKSIYRDLKHDEDEYSKTHIVDRIVDGDWRRGLTLHQLAMIDLAYLEQNDTALRWSALKITPLDESPPTSSSEPPSKKRKLHTQPEYPTISPTAFIAALKAEISPLVKAHYHLHRLPAPYNLPVIRLYISPKTAFAPRSTNIPNPPRNAVDGGRIMYIALPTSCPYIYISLSGSSSPNPASGSSKPKLIPAKVDMAHLKRIVLEAIPKALSRPHERWSLESTKLTTKSLHSVCQLRGNEKPGSGGGAYSKFHSIDPKSDLADISPVEPYTKPQAQTAPVTNQAVADVSNLSDSTTSQASSATLVSNTSNIQSTARQREVEKRFGDLGSQHAPLDRFHVTIADLPQCPGQAQSEARPTAEAAPIAIIFTGTDVFRGIKTLVKLEVDDDEHSITPSGGVGISKASSRRKGKRKSSEIDDEEVIGRRVVDLPKLPSWMTGEIGVSSYIV
jgi:central kinetochore subunit Mis15/CHL4